MTNNRTDLIKDIELNRKSRLICYITGDRQPFATKIADEVIPIFSRHLERIGKQKKISLFLYTRGGDMIVPIRLIKLVRNYTDNFEVLIPFRAHSAGTLISIGADKIVMGRLGELSPVDPTTGHPFNPQNPINPQLKSEISVEDLNSFLLFAKEKANVADTDMAGIYKLLAEKIHPLAIGNVYRAARMSRQIVEKLLDLHFSDASKKKIIGKIVNALTGDICIHGYPITRDEARSLGLNVEYASKPLDTKMWQLFDDYATDMKLNQPFNPQNEVSATNNEIEYAGSYIESSGLIDKFVFRGKIEQTIVNGNVNLNLNFGSIKWETQ